jgi:hypothetical protein
VVVRDVSQDISPEEIATLCPSLSIVKVWKIVSRKTNRPTSFIRVLTTDKWTVDHMLINGIDLYGRTFVCERCVERMECNNADRVKGHTLEIEKELGMIANAIKKEQGGKISFTKEEQKRILEASGTIRASVTQLLVEVIAAQQAQKRAAERVVKQEVETEMLKKQLRLAEERGKETKPQGGTKTRGIQTEGTPGKKVQPQAKAAPKEAQEIQRTQTSKQTEPKGEERKKEEQPKESNPQEGNWKTVSYASKLKAKIPVKEETTVKIQGKTAEEVKAKLVRTLDIERIGGPLSQVIPTKRGEVVLVSRS